MKIKHLFVAVGLCLLFSSTASAQFRLVCGSNVHTFNVVGSDIVGTATNAGCAAPAQLLGYVDFAAGRWYWYRDWPSTCPTFVEGVWFTGHIGTLGYNWRNTAGRTGAGTCFLALTDPLNPSLEANVEDVR